VIAVFELVVSIGVVIVVSATCSLFEAVLYSVPAAHVESLRQAKRRSGRLLHELRLRNVDRPIAAILSLNTIANTGGAFIAGAAFIKVYGDEWSAYFTAFITLAVLLFSEIIPKTIGVVHSRPLSAVVAYPLRFLVWALAPLVELARLVTRLIARGTADQEISEEEIATMARLGQRAGSLQPDEARTVQNILSLKHKTVREVMTPRTVVLALSIHLTVEQAQEESAGWPYSRAPVYDEDFEDVVGFVLRRDVLSAIAQDQGDTKLSELIQPIHFVAESFPLDGVLRMFLERQQHLFAVIDEYGGLAGVITLEDVLEEILGAEIVDESDLVTDTREAARARRSQVFKDQQGSEES
jgi:CBS domain containing-hemolysin-like protein